MRAGLFGGTFNPIHNGHLMVARQVLRHFVLDRLYLIPCRLPPHKPSADLAPAARRLRMIELALPGDDARLILSRIEIQRDGPSYTIDTVNQFRTRIIPDADLFLVMGLDAFLELHTWKSCPKLLETVQPVVAIRPADDGRVPEDLVGRMGAYIRSHLPGGYRFDDHRRCWRADRGAAIHLVETVPMAVSSSQIRQRIRQGDTIADLVPAAVNDYIDQQGLYR